MSYEEGQTSYEPSEMTRLVYLKQGEKRRFLVLDEKQFTFWSHEYWAKIGRRSMKMVQPCRVKNRIDRECPFCDHDEDSVKRCSFAGHLTVISITPVRTDGGVYCFDRQILRTKSGSSKKPGMYHVVEAIRNDAGGSLAGVTLECERKGEISEVCGDSIIFPRSCERISDPMEYLKPRIEKYLDEVNDRVPSDRQRTMESHLKWNPIEPIDFLEFFKPLDLDEIEARLRGGSRKGSSSSQGGGRDGWQDQDDPYGSSRDKGVRSDPDDVPF